MIGGFSDNVGHGIVTVHPETFEAEFLEIEGFPIAGNTFFYDAPAAV